MSGKWLSIISVAALCAVSSCGKAQNPPLLERDSLPRQQPLNIADTNGFRRAISNGDTVEPTARSYTYDLNNRSPMKFGWTVDKEGPFNGSGPGALTILNDNVYIADNAHRNIKSIDLNSGRISILPTGSLADVIAYNGEIYVVHRNKDSVFVYSPDLKEIRTIPIPPGTGERTFVKAAHQPLRLVADNMGVTLVSDHATIDTLSHSLSRADFGFNQREVVARTSDSSKW